MKKKVWVIIASAFAVIAAVVIVVFALPRGYKNVVTEDEAYNSMTTRGLFGGRSVAGNAMLPQAVVTFVDFASGEEEVFCSKPQCLHRNDSCFAFDLATNMRAENFAIMGDNLYYTVSRYDPESDKPNTIEVYETSFDGGRNRRIAFFARKETLTLNSEVRLVNGYLLLPMVTSDGNQGSVIYSEMRYDTHFYGVVNLRTHEAWETPEKSGYGVSQHFIMLQNGKLIYEVSSSPVPVDTSQYHSLIMESRFEEADELWDGVVRLKEENFRWTVYIADLEGKSEAVWSEEFENKKPTENGLSIAFYTAGNYVATNSYKAGEPDVFTLYDPEIAEPIRTLTFPEGYTYTQSAGEYLLIRNHRQTGEIDYMLYRLSDGATVSIPELGNTDPAIASPQYFISPFRSVANILIVEEDDPLTGNWRQDILRWITAEDLFSSGMDNLRTIKRPQIVS